MDFTLIKKIIEAAEKYTAAHPGDTDMGNFSSWLYANHHPQEPQAISPPEVATGETLDSVIGKLLVYLSRYAKLYTKKALEGTSLGTTDEFVFLIYLFNKGAATKMELIEVARLEKPTGMEIIRRLLSAGFVSQEQHPTDKRSKYLRITPSGQSVLFTTFEKMGQVSQVITGNLRENQKWQLYWLLQQLEDYHRPIREAAKQLDWTAIQALNQGAIMR